MIRATKDTNTHPPTNKFKCTETISLLQTHNPSPCTSSFNSFALLIKSCSNTGYHTSLSFTLGLRVSSHHFCLSMFGLWLLKKQQMPLLTGRVFIFHPWYLFLAANSHNSKSRWPTCVHSHIRRWKVIHLVQWSSVSSSIAGLSAICYQLSVFLQAIVFSLPRRIEWIHHSSMTRDRRVCSIMLWSTGKSIAL